jgi:hypothetical protein
MIFVCAVLRSPEVEFDNVLTKFCYIVQEGSLLLRDLVLLKFDANPRGVVYLPNPKSPENASGIPKRFLRISIFLQ